MICWSNILQVCIKWSKHTTNEKLSYRNIFRINNKFMNSFPYVWWKYNKQFEASLSSQFKLAQAVVNSSKNERSSSRHLILIAFHKKKVVIIRVLFATMRSSAPDVSSIKTNKFYKWRHFIWNFRSLHLRIHNSFTASANVFPTA